MIRATMRFEGRTSEQLRINALTQSQQLTEFIGTMVNQGAVLLRPKVDPANIRDVPVYTSDPLSARRVFGRKPGREITYALAETDEGRELEGYRGLGVVTTASSHLEMPGHFPLQRTHLDAIVVYYRKPRYVGSDYGDVMITSDGRAARDIWHPRNLPPPEEEGPNSQDFLTIKKNTLVLLRSAVLVRETFRQLHDIDLDPADVLKTHNTIWQEGFDTPTRDIQSAVQQIAIIPQRDGYQ